MTGVNVHAVRIDYDVENGRHQIARFQIVGRLLVLANKFLF